MIAWENSGEPIPIIAGKEIVLESFYCSVSSRDRDVLVVYGKTVDMDVGHMCQFMPLTAHAQCRTRIR
jgi:hypothetical protein